MCLWRRGCGVFPRVPFLARAISGLGYCVGLVLLLDDGRPLLRTLRSVDARDGGLPGQLVRPVIGVGALGSGRFGRLLWAARLRLSLWIAYSSCGQN